MMMSKYLRVVTLAGLALAAPSANLDGTFEDGIFQNNNAFLGDVNEACDITYTKFFDNCTPAVDKAAGAVQEANDEIMEAVFKATDKAARDKVEKNLKAISPLCKMKTDSQINHCTDPEKKCQQEDTIMYAKEGSKHRDIWICPSTMSYFDYPFKKVCHERGVFNQLGLAAMITAGNPKGLNLDFKNEDRTMNPYFLSVWVHIFGKPECPVKAADWRPKEGNTWEIEDIKALIAEGMIAL